MKLLYFQIIILTVTFASNLSIAQEYNWVDTKTSGSKGEYNCSKNKIRNEAIYVNQKYNLKKLLEEYPFNEYLVQTFPGYKIDIHDSFLTAVRACFSEKRIKALADRNEHFEVGFSIDQDGNILYMCFNLDTNTVITPDELYCLEGNLKKNLIFIPIRKVNEKYMEGFGITTNFKEIQAGEIPDIRRQEKEQQEKEQREMELQNGN